MPEAVQRPTIHCQGDGVSWDVGDSGADIRSCYDRPDLNTRVSPTYSDRPTNNRDSSRVTVSYRVHAEE